MLLLLLMAVAKQGTADTDIYDSETCGLPMKTTAQRFVRGGIPVKENEMPWSVQIVWPEDKGLWGKCSGTLVSKKHVLTAAHCLPSAGKPARDLTNYQVHLAGATPAAPSKIQRKVKSVFLSDPYFESKEKGHDIALLELDRNIPTEIHHVCLPTKEFEIDENNNKITLTGIGTRMTGKSDENDGTLMMVEIGKRDLTFGEKGEFVVNGMDKKAGCAGDSGGGGLSLINKRQVLVGVFVKTMCGQKDYEVEAYNWFTDLLPHMPAIKEQIPC